VGSRFGMARNYRSFVRELELVACDCGPHFRVMRYASGSEPPNPDRIGPCSYSALMTDFRLTPAGRDCPHCRVYEREPADPGLVTLPGHMASLLLVQIPHPRSAWGVRGGPGCDTNLWHTHASPRRWRSEQRHRGGGR